MTESVTRKAAVGVAWMASARFGVRALGFVSTLALARLLAPEDFGLVAMAMVVASGLELLTLFNFDMALVQSRELGRDQLDSAFTLNLLIGGALALAIAAMAVPTARFYGEPRLVSVMPVIALKYLIDNAGNPGAVEFRRSLDFRPDFHMQLWPKLCGVLVTVPLAWWLRDYRALLVGMLVGAAATCLMSYRMHPHRPRWCVREARSLFRFSRWLLLNNLMSYLRNRSADLIIGRVLGPTALGIFAIATELSNLPSTEIVAPINRVLFPSYVQLADDPERLRAGFRTTLGWIALMILPLCIGLAALAEPLVRVLLGEKWLQSAPLLTLLAIAGAGLVLQATTGSVYNALGLPRMIALTGALHAAMLVPLLLALTPPFGLVGAASAILVYSVALGPATTYALFFLKTPVGPHDVLSSCWRPVVACVVLFATLHAFLARVGPLHGARNSAVVLLAGIALGAAVYATAVAVLWALAGRPQGPDRTLLHAVARWRPFRATTRSAASAQHDRRDPASPQPLP
jgi:PST family polysaccharide transporter